MLENYDSLYCLDDPNSWSLKGSYSSQIGNNLGLMVRKCTGRPSCKTEEEIAEYIKGKAFIFFENKNEY